MASTPTTPTPAFDHLSAASDALIENPDAFPVGSTIEALGRRFVLTTTDGDHEICWAPETGGRCYPVAYCLGEGRVAIERTARIARRQRLVSDLHR